MIKLENIGKNYQKSGSVLPVLDNINLTINRGDFLMITGPSGSGKSTLLAILGCLDLPTSGSYRFLEQNVDQLSDEQLAQIRNRRIGFVFQSYNLIGRLSALKNVELPMIYSGLTEEQRLKRAALSLKAVGLEHRMHHKAIELSGGQQQRVAIARAIVNNPEVIIADEPTGSLDEQSSTEIMQLFDQLHRGGKTIIFVTHNLELISYASHIMELNQGTITRYEAVH